MTMNQHEKEQASIMKENVRKNSIYDLYKYSDFRKLA